MVTTSHASQLTIPTVYAPQGQVTSTNLNGNFSAGAAVINGGLDNTNADTIDGFRFYETKSSLPAAGTQGRVIFLTSDNTLNFDTGSAFIKTVAVSGTPSQGDVIYYSGSAWTRLAAGTNGQCLTTAGAGSNPTFAGMTTQGDIEYFNGTTRTRLSPGTAGQTLQTQGAGANPTWATSSLGSWVAKSDSTSYQATTDGFVVAYANGAVSTQVDITGLTDSSNPPTTIRSYQIASTRVGQAASVNLMFPVKKNDYYKVNYGGGGASLGAMYFIPLGS